MTNFRRALLALITFITGVGLSLGIGAGIASAHHPVLEKTTARPCGADAAWTGTVTVRSDADYNKDWQNRYAVDAVPAGAYSTFVDDQTAFGPIAVGPYAATVASVTFNVDSHWKNKSDSNGQVTTPGYIKLDRPATTTCPTVNPAVPTQSIKTDCAVQDTYTIPTTQFITYKIGGNAVAAGTYNLAEGVSVTITTSTDAAHTLGTPNTWPFTGSVVEVCPVINPIAPTVDHTVICAAVDTYTIPTTVGIQYKVGGVNVATGTYNLATGVTVNITAVLSTPPNPANSVLGTPTSWSYTGEVVETCKPDDGFDPRTDNGVCTVGALSVTVTEYRTPYTWSYNANNNTWTKVVGVEVVFNTYERPLTEGELITCVPTHEPKVVTVDDGTPLCGDTSVNTTTTTTTYTYTYVFVDETPVWLEYTTVVVTHGSRPVETEPCPTTTTTTPPTTTTTVPVCVYDTSLPASSPLCVAPTTTTVAPATTVVIPDNTPLPRTGNDALLNMAIGAMLVGGGAVTMLIVRRRKVNA